MNGPSYANSQQLVPRPAPSNLPFSERSTVQSQHPLIVYLASLLASAFLLQYQALSNPKLLKQISRHTHKLIADFNYPRCLLLQPPRSLLSQTLSWCPATIPLLGAAPPVPPPPRQLHPIKSLSSAPLSAKFSPTCPSFVVNSARMNIQKIIQTRLHYFALDTQT